MLEDRDYMREPDYGQSRWRPGFRLRWTWTTTLIAAYVAVLLAEQLTAALFPHSSLFDYLALSREGIAHGYVWQLLTYQFMHAGWLHLFLNCWAIFIFGSELERVLGAGRYLALLFSSGVVGGVFQVLAAMAWPAWFDGPVVGASAGAFGLVAAYAMLLPDRELVMLLFFLIPVRMRARTLLIISAVIAIAGMIHPWNNVANAAHLGGMAMGWIYVKLILKNPALLGASEERRWFRPRTARAPEKPSTEFQETDVDAILDKISARGINSLNARERAILEAARRKMAER